MQENCSENLSVLLALKEALQVVFSCTLDMGNLAKGEQMKYETYVVLMLLQLLITR
jgi:hypothetical protein